MRPFPTMNERPFTVSPDGVRLAVRVTPGAKRSEIGGIVMGRDGRPALSIRLAARPVEGAANEALCALLGERLGMNRSRVTILRGETSRQKLLNLEGDGPGIAARLETLLND